MAANFAFTRAGKINWTVVACLGWSPNDLTMEAIISVPNGKLRVLIGCVVVTLSLGPFRQKVSRDLVEHYMIAT